MASGHRDIGGGQVVFEQAPGASTQATWSWSVSFELAGEFGDEEAPELDLAEIIGMADARAAQRRLSLDAQLLAQLARQGEGRGLRPFDAAAGEFPFARVLAAGAAAGEEDFSRAEDDGGADGDHGTYSSANPRRLGRGGFLGWGAVEGGEIAIGLYAPDGAQGPAGLRRAAFQRRPPGLERDGGDMVGRQTRPRAWPPERGLEQARIVAGHIHRAEGAFRPGGRVEEHPHRRSAEENAGTSASGSRARPRLGRPVGA